MNEPRRRYGVIGMAELAERRGVKKHDCELNHTVPYGTGPFLDKSQAIKLPGYGHLIPTGLQTINTCPHFRPPQHVPSRTTTACPT